MPTSMNISLPEPMQAFIEERVQSGGYGNVSEYIRELVCRDQKECAEDRLEALLLEGIHSGDPVPVTPEYWADLRKEVAARRAGKQS